MQYSFPRKLRLKESNQFDRVFKQAHKISTGKFAVFYCANDTTNPRLGIVATKKNLPKAIQRNNFKRIVRESFRKKQPKLKNYDFIVFAYKLATSTPKKELTECLEKLWNKFANLGLK